MFHRFCCKLEVQDAPAARWWNAAVLPSQRKRVHACNVVEPAGAIKHKRQVHAFKGKSLGAFHSK